jgi:uncharacterized protein YodC (DUF2158 family)
MAFEPGDVVVLKSGGQSMTVASVSDDEAHCLWLGEDGELIRETIPSVALESLRGDPEDDNEDNEDDEDDEDNDDEDDEDDEEEPASSKKENTEEVE